MYRAEARKLALAHYFNTAEERGADVVTRKSDDLPPTCSVLDIEAGELEEPQRCLANGHDHRDQLGVGLLS